MANRITMVDGRSFYPLLNGDTYGGYGYYSNSNKELSEAQTPVPYEEEIIRFSQSSAFVELAIGKACIEKCTSPYMDNYFVKFYENFPDDKKVVYDIASDTISVDDGVAELIFNKENYSNHNEWFNDVSKFIYAVMSYRNPYVYNLFSEYTLESKRLVNNVNGRNRWYAMINIWNHIDALINIEKVAKSVGAKFIFDGILEENFSRSQVVYKGGCTVGESKVIN